MRVSIALEIADLPYAPFSGHAYFGENLISSVVELLSANNREKQTPDYRSLHAESEEKVSHPFAKGDRIFRDELFKSCVLRDLFVLRCSPQYPPLMIERCIQPITSALLTVFPGTCFLARNRYEMISGAINNLRILQADERNETPSGGYEFNTLKKKE